MYWWIIVDVGGRRSWCSGGVAEGEHGFIEQNMP
jgi:hypothetical protein